MELRGKFYNFDYYNKSHFLCNTQRLKVFLEALFNWKLLLSGIVSAMGIWKNFPILQVGGHALGPPTWPVIRIVWLQSEGQRKDL